MTTIVNNNQKRFFVQSQGFGNQKDIVCNLENIPKVIRKNFGPEEPFKIVQYFNRALKTVSKKQINEMFAAHKINFKIK